MVDHRDELLSEEAACALLDVITPGSVVLAIDSLPGSFSNFTHLVEARSADGSVFRIVVRRYAVFGSYDRSEKARREFKTLELVQRYGIPAPRPLYLDEKGGILEGPGIVTDYMPGEMILSPVDPLSRARVLATMLSRIHSVPCHAEAQGFLLDANAEATWFVRSEAVPDYMNVHPDGATVWQAARDLLPDVQPVPPTLVHIDYWLGNVLWDRDRIAAVVDWEEAAYGDPGIDVAYCRMDMFLNGMGRRAADEFLNVYEAEIGRRVVNLGFWELAAAARPMFSPEGWITGPPAKERFGQFIADARMRAGY
ncbi:MAG: phosphotransferase [Anaerolineae bacterium]|nr:phosphotransferase [Anaerolineae bacterium]